jgi:phosphonate transport system substrate-binding protein
MNAMRRRLCLAAGLALLGVRPGRAADAPLRLGVMPVYNARALMQSYDPLRAYLARLAGRPVRIETAPDFAQYLRRILAGEYELCVAAAHLARIAQLDAGLRPLAQFEPDHDTLLIVRADRPLKSFAELAGGEVAVIDRLAITVMGALHHLEKQGLRPDRDFRVTEHRNHASVAHALISGNSRLGVTTSHGLRQLPPDLGNRVAVHGDVVDIPAFVVLAGPGLPAGLLPRLRGGLLDLPNSAEGRAFLANTGYSGLHPADEAAMRRADPFLKETRRLLAGP